MNYTKSNACALALIGNYQYQYNQCKIDKYAESKSKSSLVESNQKLMPQLVHCKKDDSESSISNNKRL